MNAIVPQGIQARNECMKISKVARWFISPQNQAPLVGAFQDGLIGLAELTKDGLNFNKWHAMNVFGDINTKGLNYDFREKKYDNRELVSRLLPEINFTDKSPSIYRKEYATLLKYNPKDIKVVIKRGKLQSGILDKATAGQGVMGSIFHVIANEYGNDHALETVYNLQQIVHRFFLYHGFTVGINDINISEDAMKEVKRRIAGMILESRKITQRLNNGKLIAPLGMTLADFYENERVWTMANSAGTASVALNGYTIVEGDVDITVNTTGTAWAPGQVFTIAGVFDCHPETKAAYGSLKQFVVATGTTATNVIFTPAIRISGARKNVAAASGADITPSGLTTATVTIVGSASTNYVQSLMYHKDAYTFVTGDLPLMADAAKCVVKKYDGISLRVWQASDIRNDELLTRIDILYGYAAIRPQWGCRMIGSAN